jgi:hypothetical protein
MMSIAAAPTGLLAVSNHVSPPTVSERHRPFLKFDGDNNILFVTELSVSLHSSLEIKSELYEIVDQFALWKRNMHPSAGGGILKLGFLYETQINDALVEESVHVSFANSNEITVPHTRLGLISYAIGAFLNCVKKLTLLRINTCDHLKIREAMQQWQPETPNLPKFVIRNDCSNGFWNAASLAFLAEISKKHWTTMPACVVIAHTNSEFRFSAPEWAVVSFQFLVCPGPNSQNYDDNRPQPGKRYLLHDFADDASWAYLDASYEVLLCGVVRNLIILNSGSPQRMASDPSTLPGVHVNNAGFIDNMDMVKLFKYSVITPTRWHFNWTARRVFRDYVSGIASTPNAQFNRRVTFNDQSEFQPNFVMPDGLVFGMASPLNQVQYDVEHEVLSIHYANLLLRTDDGQVCISERYFHRHDDYPPGLFNPQTDETVASELAIARRVVDRLRAAKPPKRTLDNVSLVAECGGASAARLILREFTSVNRLKIRIHSTLLEPELDSVVDMASIIGDLPRITDLTIDFGFRDAAPTPAELNASLTRAKRLLTAAFGDPATNGHGIKILRLMHLHDTLADACLMYLFHIEHPLSLIQIDVHTMVFDNVQGVNSTHGVMARVLMERVSQTSTLYKQLFAFRFSTTGDRDGTKPAVTRQLHSIRAIVQNCQRLRHLVLDVEHLSLELAVTLQNDILDYALPRLETLWLKLSRDTLTTTTPWNPRSRPFAATALLQGTQLRHFAYSANEVENGVDDLFRAVIERLKNDADLQFGLNSTSKFAKLSQVEFSFGTIAGFCGNYVSRMTGLCERLKNVDICIDADMTTFNRDNTYEVCARHMMELNEGSLEVPLGRFPGYERTPIEGLVQREVAAAIANDGAQLQNHTIMSMQIMSLDDGSSDEAEVDFAPPAAAAAAAPNPTPMATQTRNPGVDAVTERKQLESKVMGPDEDVDTRSASFKRLKTRAGSYAESEIAQAVAASMESWFTWSHQQRLEPRGLFYGSGTTNRRLQESLQDDRGPIHVARQRIDPFYETVQKNRLRWMMTMIPKLRNENFRRKTAAAAAVQLAASRMLHQTAFWMQDNAHANSTLQSTLGCAAFGQFFGTGVVSIRQGFETPGTRPGDEFIDFRVATVSVADAPGSRVRLQRSRGEAEVEVVVDVPNSAAAAAFMEIVNADFPNFVAGFIEIVDRTHRDVASRIQPRPDRSPQSEILEAAVGYVDRASRPHRIVSFLHVSVNACVLQTSQATETRTLLPGDANASSSKRRN